MADDHGGAGRFGTWSVRVLHAGLVIFVWEALNALFAVVALYLRDAEVNAHAWKFTEFAILGALTFIVIRRAGRRNPRPQPT
jgi:hypothetical protein